MRALPLLAALVLFTGCGKRPKEPVAPDAPVNPPVAPPTPTAGRIEGNDLATEWEADGANRAQVKDKYFGKRWDIDLCENLTLEPDHAAIRAHPNLRWVTTRIYFRDPKTIASIDWLGSKKRVRVNALCESEFTFRDAVLVTGK